ncbi:phosphoenolpyruvate synthase [Adhaeribacter pallidiroseus]|uniref:Pyruvate, water dikinase n=1 Tax=Adhaeribacter pallidiroseus TaxID=2072847 RepID=A0A369QQL0_9BACT|nr:phosphoenolpyruvate synthase [Adhaeribacter pallidiroseus]RDC65576.1 Pyruvate, water dikinase [Adhaeribacter pallidiroseus]
MGSYVLGFPEIYKTKLAIVGGKGANLGELTRIEEIQVPAGFCISTEAFKRILQETPFVEELLKSLSLLRVEDRATIVALSAEIRQAIEETIIPQDIQEEITHHLARLGADNAYAVRSSATAEDLPIASFAGQQDTYLNSIGKEEIFKNICRCWASLFTERAIIYRLQNNFDHCKVYLAVVVQQMVFSQAAGVLFTADPITANRKVLSIDASFGLGEAVVSGLVNADNYKVRKGQIIDKKISAKKRAILAVKNGGTKEQAIEPEQQNTPTLTDEQILQLERLGRKIEAYFNCPQDIEWCLVDDTFYVVQSRPITTLYPIPEAQDAENHVYVSVGHQQMMTDPMKPLGLSLWQLTAGRPMYQAGGRLFVDVAPDLASPAKRAFLVNVLGKSDPLIKSALTTILERKDFISSLPDNEIEPGSGSPKGMSPAAFQVQLQNDPSIITELIKDSQTLLETLKHDIQAKSGVELIDFILEDRLKLQQRLSYPKSFGAIMTGMNALTWLNEKMMEWLGEKNVADTLSQSAPNNITSEMGLALLDVADVIRPYPEVVAYLKQVKEEDFLKNLIQFNGGQEARDAILTYLDKYGMRCPGEIDITRTRWSEKPIALVPLILNNIKNMEPGAGSRKFAQGQQEALKKNKSY